MCMIMETSSEDSFFWTDTDSSSVVSLTMAGNQSDRFSGETDSEKHYKKLQRQLFENDRCEISKKSKKSNIDETTGKFKRKKIKAEPESDIGLIRKTKKIKKHDSSFSSNNIEDINSYDESYLNMMVKQELLVQSTSIKHKTETPNLICKDDIEQNEIPKKEIQTVKKVKLNEECNGDDINKSCSEKDLEDSQAETIKKEKSTKNRHPDEDFHDSKILIEKFSSKILIEKFCADETVIQSPVRGKKSKKSKRERNSAGHSFTQEYSSESTGQGVVANSQSAISSSDATKDINFRQNVNTPKICDRIKFEDDEISEVETSNETCDCSSQYKHINFEDDENFEVETSNETCDYSSQNKRFIKRNLNNLPILIPKLSEDCVISNDDEVWQLKCPKDINIESLQGLDLKVENKCKLKVDGYIYEGHSNLESEQIAILTMIKNQYTISNKKCNGIIHLHKRIPKPQYYKDNIVINNEINFIPLPETTCRHPLFGTDYKSYIKTPLAVVEKLKSSNLKDTLNKKSKKKHQNKEHLTEDLKEKTNNSDYTAIDDRNFKKAKKRKHEEYSQKKVKNQKKNQKPPNSGKIKRL